MTQVMTIGFKPMASRLLNEQLVRRGVPSVVAQRLLGALKLLDPVVHAQLLAVQPPVLLNREDHVAVISTALEALYIALYKEVD